MTTDHRTTLVAAFALWVAVWATALTAASQGKPDFSGRWTAEAAPAASGGAGAPAAAPARGDLGSGWGPAIVITQDAAKLSVEIALYSRYDLQPQPVMSFALDGSESRNTLMLGRDLQSQTSRANWDGDRLRIATTYLFADPVSRAAQTMDVTRTLALESPARLVVEAAWSAALGGQPSTTRTVYARN
jgi:hypothetical protein